MLVHAIMPASRVNGPGLRCVVFVQGCNLDCPGCWNIPSHAFRGPDLAIEAVLAELVNCHHQYSLDGITFSGGEPMQQAEDLGRLLQGLRSAITHAQFRHVHRLLGEGTRNRPLFHEARRRPGPAADALALDPRSTRFRRDGQIQPPSTI